MSGRQRTCLCVVDIHPVRFKAHVLGTAQNDIGELQLLQPLQKAGVNNGLRKNDAVDPLAGHKTLNTIRAAEVL